LQVQKAKKGFKLVKSLFGKFEEIPMEWSTSFLNDCISKTSGDWGIDDSPEIPEGYQRMKILRNTDFKNWDNIRGIEAPIRLVQENKINQVKLQKEDILFETSGGGPTQPLGRTIIIDQVSFNKYKYPLGFSNFLSRFRTKDIILPKFLNYYLLKIYNSGIMKNFETQTTNLRNFDLKLFFKKILVPIPLMHEQQKITSILINIDFLISYYGEIIQKTKVLKKGLMQQLLTKGIGHTKFKRSELGSIPEEWKIIQLEDGCKKEKGSFSMGPFGSDIKTSNFVSDGIPVIRGVNLKIPPFYEKGFVFVTKEKADDLKAANAFPLDLIFTHRGTLGQVGVIPIKSKYRRYVISQSQMKCTCDEDKLRPMFAFLFFSSVIGQNIIFNHSTKSGVPHIIQPLSSLRKFPIILPTIKEQEKIISIFSTVDSRVNDLKLKKSHLELLKKGLMQKLLTGQIRVKV